ncbi:MAG: potassium transporter TrkG [Eubacterium sp.]|nr:potassium transporter TrkG [Eubacterium sp.]
MARYYKNGKWADGFFRRRSPAEVLMFGFALVILAGALLLNLPISSATGYSPGFLNCLFTATSSVCVTGLIVVDTGTYWSVFGQIVIILLIQIGGLGFMSLMTIIFVIAGRKITIKDRLLLQSSVNSDRVEGIVKFTKYIVGSSFLVEGIGAVLLSWVFVPQYGLVKGIYFGVWHSISSFCNAGFDLIGGYRSFEPYVNNGLLNITVCALIVFGGLGFAVTSELWNFKRGRRLSIHTKLVLLTTGILIFGGALLFFLFEHNNPETMGNLPWYGKLYASFYQAITPRTAGSNTISQTGMTAPSTLLTMALMFIGGSPGSTAGGIKVTALALSVTALYSVLMGKKEVTCFRRTIPVATLKRALCIFFIGVFIVFTMLMLLMVFEPRVNFESLMFEVFSAYGTVGLTRSLTGSLHNASKIVLMIGMFIGRVGPMTIAFVLSRTERRERENKGEFHLPQGNVMIG